MATRASLHRAGAAALTTLLRQRGVHPAAVACGCGGQARYHDHRSKKLLTVLGPVRVERDYYVCRRCHQGHSPRDRELNIERKDFSPGVRGMMAIVGSETSFQRGREQLELLSGLKVTAKAVEREAESIGAEIAAQEQEQMRRAKQLELPEVCVPAVPVLYVEMDGTGIPVVKAEVQGRCGRQDGVPAHTREVKLGCVFTQTRTDLDGRPVRDEQSTSYVAAIEPAEDFGLRVYTDAWRRGWSRAKKKVVIGDGAIWIWNLAAQHFPGAIQIVDLYHARQHLWELSAKLFPSQEKARKRWTTCCLQLLETGNCEALCQKLSELQPLCAELAKLVSNEIEYFARNAERMRYPSFRAQGLFVGSGVVEAGCKEVVGSRLKRSGMFWTVHGANSILALRCCRFSGRWTDYWESLSRTA